MTPEWTALLKWIERERDRAHAHIALCEKSTFQYTAWNNVIATLNDVEEAMIGIMAKRDEAAAASLPPLPDSFNAELFARTVLAMAVNRGRL